MSAADDPLEWLAEEAAHPTTRVEFARELKRCDKELVRIGTAVAEGIVPTTEAFLQADAHAVEPLTATDRAVTQRCHQLEERCYVLMARQSPVAGDLRHLVALLRSVADVQRSSSLLRHVVEALTWVHPPAMPDEVRQIITQLGARSAEIFAGGLRAWDSHDGLAANELEVADDEVDLLQKMLLTEVYTGRRSAEEAVSLALIARYYERIADHGVEMARHVAYFLTGERISSSPT